MDEVVAASGLVRRFPGLERPVLDGVELRVGRGEAVAITGPSGSGKSTLLGVLGLLDRPDAGQYLLNGADTASLSPAQAAASRGSVIGFVFQDHHLLPHLTALDNVLVPALGRSWRPDAATLARAEALLRALGLGDRLTHRPAELSTGQRQRVAVARALVLQPALVLADEPTGALDRETAASLVAVLRQEARDAALIVVTHDPEVAAPLDRTLRLRGGRLEPA
jgi:ABC-type lipoprotein export system ATPase subunit